MLLPQLLDPSPSIVSGRTYTTVREATDAHPEEQGDFELIDINDIYPHLANKGQTHGTCEEGAGRGGGSSGGGSGGGGEFTGPPLTNRSLQPPSDEQGKGSDDEQHNRSDKKGLRLRALR